MPITHAYCKEAWMAQELAKPIYPSPDILSVCTCLSNTMGLWKLSVTANTLVSVYDRMPKVLQVYAVLGLVPLL